MIDAKIMRAYRALRFGIKILSAMLVLAFVCCKAPESESKGELIVVASIYPVYDWVRNIGGERVVAYCLIPPGASPHTFNITPEQMRLISEAKIFFRIGRGLEIWTDRLVESGHKSMRVVTLSEGLLKLRVSHNGHLKEETAIKEHGHGREIGADPHVWLDPILAEEMIKKIADTLISIDPEGKSYYESKVKDYSKEIEFLHNEIKSEVSSFRYKSFVAFHSAFIYFAKRYGLEQRAVIEEFPGKEPSAKYLKELVDVLRASSNPTVLSEPQLNDKIAQIVSKEVEAKFVTVDPLGNPNDEKRDTYLKLMRYNLGQMREALK